MGVQGELGCAPPQKEEKERQRSRLASRSLRVLAWWPFLFPHRASCPCQRKKTALGVVTGVDPFTRVHFGGNHISVAKTRAEQRSPLARTDDDDDLFYSICFVDKIMKKHSGQRNVLLCAKVIQNMLNRAGNTDNQRQRTRHWDTGRIKSIMQLFLT